MIRRDYIERLIEQAIQGLAQAVALIRRGELDPGLIVIDRTVELVLESLRGPFERLDARSAVALLGQAELDRARLYAALLYEQAAVHEFKGSEALAAFLYRRSLDFYEAAQAAGCRLLEADFERLTELRVRLGSGSA